MSAVLSKWYFAINQRGLGPARDMLRAAILSCRRNTDLVPHCLYAGNEVPALDELRALGVTVIPHRSSLRGPLRRGYGEDWPIFSGHWLRLDIPEIEREADFVLYTDIDVIFRSMPARLEAPRYLAAAPEHDIANWAYFNSGVMLLNLAGMRESLEDFRASVRQRVRNGFAYPTHDQKSFNDFYAARFDRLPPEMNWKPYRGLNPKAHIVHFHGPEPGLVRAMAQSDGTRSYNPELTSIWRRDVAAYGAYVQEFDTLLAGDGRRHAEGTLRARHRPCRIGPAGRLERLRDRARKLVHW